MSVILLHCCSVSYLVLWFVRDLIGIAHGALVCTFTGLYGWLMTDCLNGTGKAFAGFKKMSPFHILYMFEVKQAVKYRGYLPRLFTTRQIFPCVMEVWSSVWKYEGTENCLPLFSGNYSLTYGLHWPLCFHKVVHLPKETSLLSHDHRGLSHHLFLLTYFTAIKWLHLWLS